jgi:hypothetical protein
MTVKPFVPETASRDFHQWRRSRKVKTTQLSVAAALTVALLGASVDASADLIQSGRLDLSGQGFGNAPRLLTIQAHGNASFESGAIGIVDGALVALTPGISDSLVYSGNGVTNMGGDEVNPLSDNQKFGIPTLGELNWSSGANVGLVFNATEPGGNGLVVDDVTLKFYDGNNVIAAIDGSFALDATDTGNGGAGFLIKVDDEQQTFLNGAVFAQAGFLNFRIALEASISGVHGGPESFSAIIANGDTVISPVPEPETYAMMLAGLGLLGFTVRRRNRARLSK